MPDEALRLYEEEELDEDNGPEASGRVTDEGCCIVLREDEVVLWSAADDFEPLPPYQLRLPAPSSSPQQLASMPSSSPASISLLCVSDDGELSAWQQPSSPAASDSPAALLAFHRLSLAREETCTQLIVLPPSASPLTTAVVGTSAGRLLALQLFCSSFPPSVSSVADSGRKGGGRVWSSLASMTRLLRWSTAGGDSEQQQWPTSRLPVLSLLPYHHAADSGVFSLTADLISQWSLQSGQPSLVWSAALDELTEEGDGLELLEMTAAASQLFLLFRRTRRGEETRAYVAVYGVDFSAEAPLDADPTVIALPSSLSSAAHLGVSVQEDCYVFVWAAAAVCVLNVSNLNFAPSAFVFSSPLLVGGGMLVDAASLRTGNILPQYDHARCLLLAAGYGVLHAQYDDRKLNDAEATASSLLGVDLSSGDADADSAQTALSVAFHLYRHGQTRAAALRLRQAQAEAVLPLDAASPQLDSLVLTVGKRIVDGQGDAGEEEAGEAVPLQLSNQLAAKQRAFATFLQFLHEHGLHELLSTSARFSLSTFAEQLAALLGLRHLLNSYPRSTTKSDLEYLQQRERVMLAVMEDCCSRRAERGEGAAGGGSVSERFFQSVTQVGDVFDSIPAVLQRDCVVLGSDSEQRRRDSCFALQALNTAVDTLLTDAARYREANRQLHSLPPSCPHPPHWTALPATLRSVDTHCHFLAAAIVAIRDFASLSSLRVDLFHYLLRLSRSLLLEYVDRVTDDKADEQTRVDYERTRAEMVALLRRCLPSDQGSRADVLYDFAAEFKDFESIISMLETEDEDGRQQRLTHYLSRFGLQFATPLFSRYHSERKVTRLLSLHEPPEYEEWLLQFLSGHGELQWMQAVQLGRWQQAGEVLLQTAETGRGEEGESWSWSHQKTLWSLGKLAFLCAEGEQDEQQRQRVLAAVNDQLDVSAAQSYAANGDPDAPMLPPAALISRLLALPHLSSAASAAAASPAFYPLKADAEAQQMMPFILAVEVYVKALFPAASLSALLTGSELLVLERIWLSALQADRAELQELSRLRAERLSDGWVLGLQSLRLYRLWQHLHSFGYYGRQTRFEESWRHFTAAAEVWSRGDESSAQLKQLRDTLHDTQQAATK